MENLLYIVLTIVGFFVVLRLYVWVLSYLKKGKKIESVNGTLGARIKTGKKLFFYFYSPNCGACRSMTPVMEKLQKEHSDIYMINVAQDINLGKAFGIMGTPAMVLVEEQRIQKYILGGRSEQYLKNFVK